MTTPTFPTPLPIRREIEAARPRRSGAKELNLRQGGEELYIYLPTVPEEVCALDQLERLNLSHNALQTLPEGLSRLSSLMSLDLVATYQSGVRAVLDYLGQAFAPKTPPPYATAYSHSQSHPGGPGQRG